MPSQYFRQLYEEALERDYHEVVCFRDLMRGLYSEPAVVRAAGFRPSAVGPTGLVDSLRLARLLVDAGRDFWHGIDEVVRRLRIKTAPPPPPFFAELITVILPPPDGK